MTSPKDMRGVIIQVGDVVIYGKSNRDNPVNIGKVMMIDEHNIHVLGRSNVKVGKIPLFHAKRLIVVPDDYLENVDDS